MRAGTLHTGVFLDLDTVDTGDLDLSGLKASLPDWRFHGLEERRPIPELVRGASVVVTNKVMLDADTLAHCRGLRLICVAATGTNNVDLEAARRLGITVSNARAYATPAVVQHVFALILALRTRLLDYRHAVSAGQWQRSRRFCLLDYPISELAGTTLGIVGLGELGGAVARVAEAFGMRVLVAERPGSPETRPGRLPLEELLPQADVLSLHCPLTPETRGMIGRDELARMRPQALLINTARGGIVDEAALAEALRGGVLGGAGIDVLDGEPPRSDHPLLAADLPNLIVTPHVAWASQESRQRLVDELTKNIQAFLAGRPRNGVTGA